MQAEKPKEQWLYNGTLDCAVKIVKDEGAHDATRALCNAMHAISSSHCALSRSLF